MLLLSGIDCQPLKKRYTFRDTKTASIMRNRRRVMGYGFKYEIKVGIMIEKKKGEEFCSFAVLQFCSFAVLQSCSCAVVQSRQPLAH
jgi:hypothetical protein